MSATILSRYPLATKQSRNYMVLESELAEETRTLGFAAVGRRGLGN